MLTMVMEVVFEKVMVVGGRCQDPGGYDDGDKVRNNERVVKVKRAVILWQQRWK